MWTQRDKFFQESSKCTASASTDYVHIDTMHGDVNDIEPKVLKLKDAQAFGRDFVNFMLKSESQVYTTTTILQMN